MNPLPTRQPSNGPSAAEITDVTIKTVLNGRDGLRGWASVTIGQRYRLNQIAIREGPNGLFITYPAKRLASGERRYHHFPVTQTAADAITKAIMTHLANLARSPEVPVWPEDSHE